MMLPAHTTPPSYAQLTNLHGMEKKVSLERSTGQINVLRYPNNNTFSRSIKELNTSTSSPAIESSYPPQTTEHGKFLIDLIQKSKISAQKKSSNLLRSISNRVIYPNTNLSATETFEPQWTRSRRTRENFMFHNQPCPNETIQLGESRTSSSKYNIACLPSMIELSNQLKIENPFSPRLHNTLENIELLTKIYERLRSAEFSSENKVKEAEDLIGNAFFSSLSTILRESRFNVPLQHIALSILFTLTNISPKFAYQMSLENELDLILLNMAIVHSDQEIIPIRITSIRHAISNSKDLYLGYDRNGDNAGESQKRRTLWQPKQNFDHNHERKKLQRNTRVPYSIKSGEHYKHGSTSTKVLPLARSSENLQKIADTKRPHTSPVRYINSISRSSEIVPGSPMSKLSTNAPVLSANFSLKYNGKSYESRDYIAKQTKLKRSQANCTL